MIIQDKQTPTKRKRSPATGSLTGAPMWHRGGIRSELLRLLFFFIKSELLIGSRTDTSNPLNMLASNMAFFQQCGANLRRVSVAMGDSRAFCI